MIQRDVKLWLGQSRSNVYLPVSQFDSMWKFVFTIYDGSTEWTIPQGAEVVLNGLKPDGNTFSFRGAISNNTVVVESDVQMTAVAGSTKCELSIMSGGKVVGTANFILSVEAAPKAPGDISSETTLPAYAEILEEIAQILADAGGGGGSHITVDNSLSPTSTNPVQNRAIKEAIDAVTRYAANNLSYFNGGTTGQVLTKASSSSLDFTWKTPSSGGGTITISETGDPPNRWLIINDGTNAHYVPLKASDTGGGKISAYALPNATTSVKGAMTAADKIKLDGLTGIPAGGSIGQVLAKASGTDKDVTWITPSTVTFYAVYGTTTSAEIEAAYQAGQTIFCKIDNDWILPLVSRVDDTEVLFAGVGSPDILACASCTADDWDYTRVFLTPEGLGCSRKITEETISTSGAVSATLSKLKITHFTGKPTSLTISFENVEANWSGYSYHFDFTTGSTATVLTLPNGVIMPSGFSGSNLSANTRYEIDILNNYGVVMSWPAV